MVDQDRFAYAAERGLDTGSSTPTGTMTINLELTAGQVVRVENDLSTLIYGTHSSGYLQSWFTGYMLFAL